MSAYLDILSTIWIVTSVIIFCIYVLLLFEDSNFFRVVIKYIKHLFLFGKIKEDDKGLKKAQPEYKACRMLLHLSSVPKRWFTHFYTVGAITHTAVLTCFLMQLMEGSLPSPVANLIQRINLEEHSLKDKNSEVNALPVMIVFMLELLQITRRMFECCVVNSFSKSTMSIIHYATGLFFYANFGIGLLASVNGQAVAIKLPSNNVEIILYTVGVLMFLWAYYHQHKCMATFASLREDREDQKDKKSLGHFIPQGHLFEMVSCPHYFCEIIIYTSFLVIFQFRNHFLLSVLVFVWTNQIISGLKVHQWYQEKFHNYPRNRKAVIPYVI